MRRAAAMLLALTLALSALPQSSGLGAPEPAASRSAPPALLRLKAGEFDLVKLPEAAALSGSGSALFVVQFTGQTAAEGLALLQSHGVAVGSYLPDQAYLVRMEAREAAQLARTEGIRAVARFRPAWKLEVPSEAGEAEFWVEVFPGTLEEAKTEAVRLGATEIRPAHDSLFLRLDRKVALALAQSEAVVFIEERKPVTLRNDIAAGLITISGSDQVWTSGLAGEGERVGVADTGLDTGSFATLHPDLVGQVAAIYARGRPGNWSDPNGHGTHVAGSVAGSGASSNGQIRGMAPGAQLVFQSVLDPQGGLGGIGDVYDLFNQAYNAGARIHSNSWGIPYAFGGWVYDGMARRVDQFIWDHRDLSVLIAAGNDGDYNWDGQIDLRTVSSPSTAKNAIAIGATENNRPTLGTPHADDPNSVARFSSRGTAPDGRVKPDLVAPGGLILSTKSSLVPPFGSSNRPNLDPDYNLIHAAYDSHYELMSGTSMATPIAAGATALVRQYFTEVKHIDPTASLVKAALINGAQDLGDGWMSRHQGWGRIDLTNTLYPEDDRVNWHENEAYPLLQGDEQRYAFFVEAGQILKVTLVWTDPAPSSAAAIALVNDLDLEVVAPNGTVYLGNCFTANRKTAATNCSADTINNVENVYIAAPETGLYQVRVHGRQVNQGAQPYSLVVSGQGLSNGGRIICTDTPYQAPTMAAPQGMGATKAPLHSHQVGALAVSSLGNNCAQALVGDDGRFNFALYQPAQQAWYNTSYYWPWAPWSSFTTIRVDGEDAIFGEAGSGFIRPPANEGGLTNISIWQQGDVAVRQTIEIAANPATGEKDATAIRYTMTNTGASAHQVGLRLMIDTTLGGNDGAPFRVPGAHGSMEPITTERDYVGAAVPDLWQAFQDLSNPAIAAQMSLRGGDATPPDRMAIAYWGQITGTTWDYSPNPTQPVTWDSAVAMWWNPVKLEPGETRSLVVYYGRPRIEGGRALTLTCPATLTHEEWQASGVNLAAYFTNPTTLAYPAVRLEVASEMALPLGDPVHPLGNVAAGGTGSATWRLQPAVGGTYRITVRAYQQFPDGRSVLVERADCQVIAQEPAVPANIHLGGTVGAAEDGTPMLVRCHPLTVAADYTGEPVTGVTLLATDGAGVQYIAAMTGDGAGHWAHTFTPCAVGLLASPLQIELRASVAGAPGPIIQRFEIILIDPSGFIYHATEGQDWRLPGAVVTLQYHDPALATWVTMTPEAYPGLFLPLQNPEVTGPDGWYAWDVAPGDYRVLVSRPGFANAASRVVTIPPEVVDLHVGLLPTDGEAPVVTASGLADGGSYPGPVSLTLQAVDQGEAGVRALYYRVDGASAVRVEQAQLTLPFDQQGQHQVSFWAVDHAGNSSAPQSLTFQIGAECTEPAPSVTWLPPLSMSAPAPLPAGDRLDIQFRWGRCGQHLRDESVSLSIRDGQSGRLITSFTYGYGIAIDDAEGLYRQPFRPADYGVAPGRELQVILYVGGKRSGIARIRVE